MSMHDGNMNRTKRYLAVKSMTRAILDRSDLWGIPKEEFDACMRAVAILEGRAEDIINCRDVKH